MDRPLLELTVKQVADLLGVSAATVYRRIKSNAYKTMPDPMGMHVIRLPADQFCSEQDDRIEKIREKIMAV